MKKISRLATTFILAASITLPLVSLAAATVYCAPGYMGKDCITPPSSGSSGGGINLNVITPYSAAIINFINGILVPILMAVAFLTFLWGVFKYFILGATDEKSRTDGRQFVLWGLIGFVVILSIWGLVWIVGGTFGLPLGGFAPRPPLF